MPLLNHQSLRRDFDARVKDKQPGLFFAELSEGLRTKQLRPEEFSVRQLFESFVDNGREMVESWRPGSANGGYNVEALESASYVSTAHFSNIIGQILFTKVLEEGEKADYLFDQLVNVIPTQFNGEKLPGIGGIGDRVEQIGEGDPYPLAGLNEEYIETPPTIKRGLIIGLTKEALFFDRTGVIMARAGAVAETIFISREKRVLDCVTGITNTYKRNGSAQNTYNASTPWANIAASNALVDWTDIEAAELKFDGMVDLNTGEPITTIPKALLVPSALKHTAKRIVNATEIRYGDGASNTTQTISESPVAKSYQVLSSPYVYNRTSSTSTWFIGDPKAAFAYMQNWGPEVTKAPSNSEIEFTQDIVQRWKVSERGAPAVLYPQKMVKCTQ